jgi:hypothetical protein
MWVGSGFAAAGVAGIMGRIACSARAYERTAVVSVGTTRAIARWRMNVRSALILCASMAMCACAPRLPTLGAPRAAGDGFEEASRPEPPGMSDDPSDEYALAPGDVLRVRALVGEGFAVERLVLDGRGRGVLPLAGEVPIAGVSLATATERINEALRGFHRFATVHVELLEPLGHRARGRPS